MLFACDLGSTTIDAALITADMRVLATAHKKNPQSLYGADVITRIFSAGKPKVAKKLRESVIGALCDMAGEMCEEVKASGKQVQIEGGTICGNTTMISLLMGYDVSAMGAYPFPTPFRKSFTVNFRNLLEINYVNQDAKLILSGCASAFLGGDVLAGVLSLQHEGGFSDNETSLLLDLGTNGEMFLNHKGKCFATTAACGPAFEGCVRKQGAYGSSALDAVALGLASGRISKNGMCESGQFSVSGLTLNNHILEQLLLAKAAIRAGVDVLLQTAGITSEQVDCVYIAGGFGFYLKEDTAVQVGLIPQAFAGRMKTVGNTSLQGAKLLCAGNILPKELDELSENTEVIQAANMSGYREILLSHMYFAKN